MARASKYEASALLDAAVRLAAAGGAAAVTMSAVAREVEAPNGSVYHRFPHRSALLAEVWLRTAERFQEGFLDALGSHAEPHLAGGAAARHAVEWSRAHPEQAGVLLHGAEAFGRADWGEAYRRRVRRADRRDREALADLAQRLGASAPAAADRVRLAVVDLPLAVVRRHLRTGSPLPPHAEELAEQSAITLLAPPSPR